MSLQITVQQDQVTQQITTTAVASGDNVETMIADLKRIFPSLLAGTALPPMQDQPKRDEPATPKQEIIEPAKEPKKRAPKAKEPETIEGTVNKDEPAKIPDIELVRHKLKSLGSTDGLGHDKVFEVLGKYGAKNASTVPEDKRAELIAEIDGLIAGVGK